MTPQKFIAKWLPDYEEKYRKECLVGSRSFKALQKMHLFDLKYFQEALDNYAKKQRELCADKYARTYSITYNISPLAMEDEILNAPQPKID